MSKVAKKKYLDQTRFPKVVTEGYEKKFKLLYKSYLRGMSKDLMKTINNFIN